MMSALTPVAAVVRGALAGAAGTVAMDALLFSRYRRAGGETPFAPWELSSGISRWEEAPAPAIVGKRLVEGLFERRIPSTRAPLLNNLTHWGYGVLAGVQYGIVARLAAAEARALGVAVRRGRLRGRIRDPARGEALRADLEARPCHAREGPQRTSGLRTDDRRHAPVAREVRILREREPPGAARVASPPLRDR